jgi:cysteinyl-tRNA synthetase
LKLFNTLTRSKAHFEPLEPGHAKVYVCGITVYDHCHIGHARMLVSFDLLRRWLLARGLRVSFVRNITDIDDKIIRRAVERGISIAALTEEMIASMAQDCAALKVLPPDHEPRATRYVPQMLSMISRLEQKGLAYQDQVQGQPGDVHYAVRGFAGYGQLSGKSIEELRAGERVAVAEGKRDPLDFVLWKRAKPEEPLDAVWQSPYGPGRPGWHIECSAMGCDLLGYPFDIHGGGADLQFPHHENEIAQSEGAYRPEIDQPFVRLWMHNGFVRIDDEKMSKSLGNFFTIKEVLARIHPEVLRAFLLRTHYRSPLNYSDVALDEARQGLVRLYNALEAAGQGHAAAGEEQVALQSEALKSMHPQAEAFRAAMDDDLNTPEAFAALFALANEVQRGLSTQPQEAQALARVLRGLGISLGLLDVAAAEIRQSGVEGLSAPEIEALIQARASAKAERRYSEADAIRADLLAQGVVLEDSPQGTTWRFVANRE